MVCGGLYRVGIFSLFVSVIASGRVELSAQPMDGFGLFRLAHCDVSIDENGENFSYQFNESIADLDMPYYTGGGKYGLIFSNQFGIRQPDSWSARAIATTANSNIFRIVPLLQAYAQTFLIPNDPIESQLAYVLAPPALSGEVLIQLTLHYGGKVDNLCGQFSITSMGSGGNPIGSIGNSGDAGSGELNGQNFVSFPNPSASADQAMGCGGIVGATSRAPRFNEIAILILAVGALLAFRRHRPHRR